MSAELYGITTPELFAEPTRLDEAVDAALSAGLRWIQYRNKQAGTDTAYRQAERLHSLCRQHAATLIINDDPGLAQTLGCGLHVGAADPELGVVRERLGSGAIIGVSCQADVSAALRNIAGGASYVSMGRLFPSQTKPDAPPADLQCLHKLRKLTTARICAIGGITMSQLPLVAATGVDLIAVGASLFNQRDVFAATTNMLSTLLPTPETDRP